VPRRHAEHLTLHRTDVRVDIDLHSLSLAFWPTTRKP
jgi:hypothetical protein